MNTRSQNRLPSCWTELVAVVAIIIFLILLFPLALRHRRPPDTIRVTCLNNLKSLGYAMNLYQSDWDGRLIVLRSSRQQVPPGQSWTDRILPYARNKNIITCPEPQRRPTNNDRLSYSFNTGLSGIRKSWAREPHEVALWWDTVSDSPANNNIHGTTVWRQGTKHLPRVGDFVVWTVHSPRACRRWPAWARPRHEGYNNVVYLDGHAVRIGPGVVPRFSPE